MRTEPSYLIGAAIAGGRSATIDLLRSGEAVYAHNPDTLRAELDQLRLAYLATPVEADRLEWFEGNPLFGPAGRGVIVRLVG